MPIRPPTREDLRDVADTLYLDLTDDELEFFLEMTAEQVDSYETVRSHNPEPRPAPTRVRERNAGTRPEREENPHCAWVTRCTVSGDDGGELEGMELAIKDNICVAGVEMTCGSHVVEGFVPNVDATVVTRVLEAGADIIGKSNMDDMAMTTTGHSAFGVITNPHDEEHTAGGSSGGSAVLVATGEVDASIGTDQGGSVRIPAAFCGVVGFKPTYGLVPYTGSVGLEHTIDHPGPMGPDVETVARVLSVIAGSNERDLRRSSPVPVEQYEEALDGDISEYKIGILQEGFEHEDANPAVNERVRDAIEVLGESGVTIEDVSLPLHADARAIHSVCAAEGLVASMASEGLGHGWRGWYDTTWVDAFGKFRRVQSDDFPAALKLSLLMGAYTGEEYHSRYYASGMNLVLELTERYDDLLSGYDVLAMPTTGHTAPEHDPNRTEFERLREVETIANTASFNRTGHPALSVPAGDVDGLPVGLMLVGSRFDDATVLNVGYALEQARADEE